MSIMMVKFNFTIMTPDPSLPTDSRRDFVKKSIAVGVVAAQPTILAGLIRAAGPPGGGTTTSTTAAWYVQGNPASPASPDGYSESSQLSVAEGRFNFKIKYFCSPPNGQSNYVVVRMQGELFDAYSPHPESLGITIDGDGDGDPDGFDLDGDGDLDAGARKTALINLTGSVDNTGNFTPWDDLTAPGPVMSPAHNWTQVIAIKQGENPNVPNGGSATINHRVQMRFGVSVANTSTSRTISGSAIGETPGGLTCEYSTQIIYQDLQGNPVGPPAPWNVHETPSIAALISVTRASGTPPPEE